MDVIRSLGVLVGAMIVGGCAAHAQSEVAEQPSGYFEASAPAATNAKSTELARPLAWARVDPRFRINVDELSLDVDDWVRTSGRTVEVAPLIGQLADAIDAIPRGDESGPLPDSAAIRAISDELSHRNMDGASQRRATRQALLMISDDLAAEAQGAYAADPKVGRAVGEVRSAALGISDSAPDSAVVLGVVTARDAVRAFALALASGRVATTAAQENERTFATP
jgi:hypothetical protein